MRTGGRALTLLGIVVGLVLLWLAARDASWQDTLASLSGARPAGIAPLSVTLLAFYWLKALRWRYLLAPIADTSGRALFGPVMVGYAGSAVLPMQLGELVRIVAASHRLQTSKAALLSSIALERVFDVLSLAVLLAAALLVYPIDDADLDRVLRILGGTALLGIIVTAAFLWNSARLIRLMERILVRAPVAVREFASHNLHMLAEGLAAVRHPGLMAQICLASMMQWLVMLGPMYVSCWAVGIDMSLFAALLLVVACAAVMLLPAAPGNIGAYQFAFVFALQLFGIGESQALAASVYFHVSSYAVVFLCAGTYWWVARRWLFRAVRNDDVSPSKAT